MYQMLGTSPQQKIISTKDHLGSLPENETHSIQDVTDALIWQQGSSEQPWQHDTFFGQQNDVSKLPWEQLEHQQLQILPETVQNFGNDSPKLRSGTELINIMSDSNQIQYNFSKPLINACQSNLKLPHQSPEQVNLDFTFDSAYEVSNILMPSDIAGTPLPSACQQNDNQLFNAETGGSFVNMEGTARSTSNAGCLRTEVSTTSDMRSTLSESNRPIRKNPGINETKNIDEENTNNTKTASIKVQDQRSCHTERLNQSLKNVVPREDAMPMPCAFRNQPFCFPEPARVPDKQWQDRNQGQNNLNIPKQSVNEPMIEPGQEKIKGPKLSRVAIDNLLRRQTARIIQKNYLYKEDSFYDKASIENTEAVNRLKKRQYCGSMETNKIMKQEVERKKFRFGQLRPLSKDKNQLKAVHTPKYSHNVNQLNLNESQISKGPIISATSQSDKDSKVSDEAQTPRGISAGKETSPTNSNPIPDASLTPTDYKVSTDFSLIDTKPNSESIIESRAPDKLSIVTDSNDERNRDDEAQSRIDESGPATKKQRFLKTAVILEKSGLMEITLKTAAMLQNSHRLQVEIDQVRAASKRLLISVLNNPENVRIKAHVMRKLNLMMGVKVENKQD